MSKFLFALAFFVIFPAFSLAQTPIPTPPPPVKEDGDVVKISTALIQIDVSVTDKRGNPVKDLKPEEVEIYENGKRQEITNFSFISNVRERSVEPAEKPDKASAAPPPPVSNVRPEQVRRTIALVVDDLTLSFESIYYTRRALKKFVDEQMQEGDLVAIIRTGGGIGALQQFTTDRRQLYAAIEKIKWTPFGSGGISAFSPIEATPLEQAKANGAQITDEQLEAEKDFLREGTNFREDIFATGTLGAINFIIRGMRYLPGRKSIMLLSDGFSIFSQTREGFTEPNRVLDSLRRLVDLANRSSVVVYTLDARGLAITGMTAADNTSGLDAAAIEQRLSDRREKLFNSQEGLVYLARQTGGFPIINNNDLSAGIRKILDDQSYYLIGYQPDDETFDPVKRRFNKLEIKVKRPGVNVRYRSGFFGVSDEQFASKPAANMTAEQRIINALTSPFAAGEIPLRLNAVFGHEGKTGSFVRSFMHIDGENLTFTDLPDGKKKAVFDILAMNFGDNGTAVDQISKTFTATVSSEVYREIKRRGMIYDFVFPVKNAGAYQLRVALHDQSSGKVGSASQFVEVPNIKKNRLTLSGIMLENMKFEEWQKLAAGQTETSVNSDPIGDTALRQFKRGTVLNYGSTIYNAKIGADGKPNATIQARIFHNGKLVYEGKPQPVSTAGQKDMQRLQSSGSLSLGTEMAAGDYVLQIIVTDNLAKKNRQIASQFVPFEIVQDN
jgi:VWFA-related protein